VHGDHGAEIGEECQRQPFQHRDVATIGHEDLQDRAERAEGDDVNQDRPSDQQSERVCHGTEIGADIDRVGGEKQRNDHLQQPIGIMLA